MCILHSSGVDTVSWTLSVITYHLLAQPELQEKLRRELKDLPGTTTDMPSITVLEQLPYLNAVMFEGLRLATISARLMRIAPDSDLEYHSSSKARTWRIPAGISIGM